MTNLGEIANRIARRFCTHEHQGASPCAYCAELRYIALTTINEYLEELVKDLERHRQ